MSSLRISKSLRLVLFEGIFAGRVTPLCLAQPREREANRPTRLKTRAHEKVLAERELCRIKHASALHGALH